MLLFIVAPFFVTYLIRTLAWETILSDNGSSSARFSICTSSSADGRLLATSTAVVAGITYNFLPFMALPLYVSLEQVDHRLIEAARTCTRATWRAFLRVTLPLSLPGVVAGTLLTFIPAAGDFINAQLLGSPDNHMIGNVIQSQVPRADGLPGGGSDVVHPDGRDPGRGARLRTGGRHRAADGDGGMSAVAVPRGRRNAPRAGRSRRHLLTLYSILFFAYLLLPIAIVIAFSFNHPVGQVQLHLARVHVRQLAVLERRTRDPERGLPVARDRALASSSRRRSAR